MEMKTPPVVSAQEWEAARQQLLVKEKALTRARDALAAERRRMPWLAVEKEYAFDGPEGQGEPPRPVRRPPSADRLPRLLRARRVRLARPCVPRLLDGGRPGRPRRPSERARHHARVRLARATGGHRAPEGTNGLDDAVVQITDSFDKDFGVDEWHGTNAFIRDGNKVFRTYFVNNRGDEQMGSTWNYLDITALGRQEEWEDSPEGYPQTPPYKWWNWHDAYDNTSTVPVVERRRSRSRTAGSVRRTQRQRLTAELT